MAPAVMLPSHPFHALPHVETYRRLARWTRNAKVELVVDPVVGMRAAFLFSSLGLS